MEWDFTPSQVMKGEVNYTIEDFLRDLRSEMDYNFEKKDDKFREKATQAFYRVMYFSSLGKSPREVSEMLCMDEQLVTDVLKELKPNIEMFIAIVMRQFLCNLKASGGMLPNTENLRLINGRMRRFHNLHNL